MGKLLDKWLHPTPEQIAKRKERWAKIMSWGVVAGGVLVVAIIVGVAICFKLGLISLF